MRRALGPRPNCKEFEDGFRADLGNGEEKVCAAFPFSGVPSVQVTGLFSGSQLPDSWRGHYARMALPGSAGCVGQMFPPALCCVHKGPGLRGRCLRCECWEKLVRKERTWGNHLLEAFHLCGAGEPGARTPVLRVEHSCLLAKMRLLCNLNGEN